eukprot:SAG31_NODE_39797_length_285_cov_1.080645_1_plen_53_part_10
MFGAEGDGAHITTTANVLAFGGTNRDGSERVETYDGTAVVRGISCDKWINVVA